VERRAVDRLTARNDPRYSADAQSQALHERVRRLSRVLFMRADHGRWRISKTKGIAWLTLGVAAVGFWNYLPRPNLATTLEPPSVALGSSRAPSGGEAAAVPVRPTEALKPPAFEVTPPPKLPAPRLEPPPPAANTASQPAPTVAAPAYNPYLEPPTEPPHSAPLTIPQAQPFAASPAAPTFPLEQDQPNLPPLERETQRTAAPRGVAPAPTPLVERPTVSSQAPKPLIEPEAARAKEDDLQTQAQTALEPDGLGEANVLVDAMQSAQTASSNPVPNVQNNGVLFDVTQPAQTTNATVAASSNATNEPNSAYPPGTRIAARLEAGVIVVQRQESPVVARFEDGTLAFGKATLNGSRVAITVLEVVRDGVSSTVSASALAADGFPGLAVQLREDRPDVVQQLWQAGLQGVSSYAQDAIRGETTTIANGATNITSPQPNLGLSLLQSLAQTFLAPSGQPTVKYARLEPDTGFQVLFAPTR
jgi:hypothetical protein